MSRVAVLCALLLLAACGSASTTSAGSSSTGSSSTPASASSPAAPASSAAPAGVWTGVTAAGQFTQITDAFNAAKDPAIDAFNAFGAGDLPSDADFAGAWAPVARACIASQQASATAAQTLVADHQAGHWSAAGWKSIRKSLKEIQWWGRTQKACGAVKTKPQLLKWMVGMDLKRAAAITGVLDQTRGVLINS